MEQQIMWLAGVSITGFMVLAGWSYNLQGKVSAMMETAKKVDEIHAALLGTMAGKVCYPSSADNRNGVCFTRLS